MKEPVIHVVDDDQSILKSVSALLSSLGMKVKSYDCPLKFLDECDFNGPNCVILDVRMPRTNGIEILKHIKMKQANSAVIMISGHADVPMAVESLQIGAATFLEKPFRPQDLINKVQDCVDAQIDEWNSAENEFRKREQFDCLTNREKQVLDLLVDGKTSKEAGRTLKISHRTVEIHRSNILSKLDAKSMMEVSKLARKFSPN